TSGNASTGRLTKAQIPAPTKSATPRTTKSGWYSANAMMRLINPSVLRGEQALEKEVAVHHHLVGRGDAAEHRLVAVTDGSGHDRAPRVAAAALVDEHEMLLAAQIDRPRGHEVAARRGELQLRDGEHLGLQALVRRVDNAAYLYRARLRIDELGDVQHVPRDPVVAERSSRELDLGARLHARDVLLGNVEEEPQARRVRDHEQRLVAWRIGAQLLPGVEGALPHHAG